MYKELSCKKREQKGESQVDNRYILDQEKYAAIARRASAEGCVLLRNKDQALPLKEGLFFNAPSRDHRAGMVRIWPMKIMPGSDTVSRLA